MSSENIVFLGKTFGMAENGVVYALYNGDKAKVADYIGKDKNVKIANKVIVNNTTYDVIHMDNDVIVKLYRLSKL